MNIPKIKILIYKNNVEGKPIEKIGNITIAHLENMQENLSQEEDVTDYFISLHVNHVKYMKKYASNEVSPDIYTPLFRGYGDTSGISVDNNEFIL